MSMKDIESLDDMALRVSERCRDIINEEVVRYFGNLIVASGQHRVRVVQSKVKPGRGTPKARKGPPPKERQLLDMLRDGPKTSTEIMNGLDIVSAQMGYVVGKAKALLMGTKKVMRCRAGRMGKPSVYALRDVDYVEGDKK